MRPDARNVLLVARREYVQRVRNRAFVVLCAFVAALAFVIVLLPIGLRALGGNAPTRIALVSEATQLPADPAAALRQLLGGAGPGGGASALPVGSPSFVVTIVADVDAGRAAVRDGAVDAVLVLRRAPAPDGELTFEYIARGSSGGVGAVFVRQAATALALHDRLARAGIAAAAQAQLFAPTPFVEHGLDAATGPAAPDDTETRSTLGYLLNVLIFMAIVTYGYWVATSVAEEKGSRVMELLISAATPNQLLIGKVIGSGAAGLTQYGVLVAAGAVGLLLQGPLSTAVVGTGPGAPAPPPVLPPAALVGFGVYFALGFALYAGLYAAAGSIVGRPQDAAQVGTPITMLATAGYIATTFAAITPDAPWVGVASQVPLFTPFFMVMRLAAGRVGPGEIALSLVLMLVGIALALTVASRVYRAGVLLYGQRPSARALIAAAVRAGR